MPRGRIPHAFNNVEMFISGSKTMRLDKTIMQLNSVGPV